MEQRSSNNTHLPDPPKRPKTERWVWAHFTLDGVRGCEPINILAGSKEAAHFYAGCIFAQLVFDLGIQDRLEFLCFGYTDEGEL